MKAPKEVKARAKQLREAVNTYRALYHEKDESPITPEALDSLKYELAELEEKYPELVTKDSPTQMVAGAALPELKKVRHEVSQWSFNDAFTEDDIRAFDERVRKITGAVPSYDLELKIDGLKIVYTYKEGKLVTAATRGDGIVGEDVTHNIRTVRDIPQTLAEPVDCIVEGEIYLTRSGLTALNKKTRKGGTAYIRKSPQRRRRFHPPARSRHRCRAPRLRRSSTTSRRHRRRCRRLRPKSSSASRRLVSP